MRWLRRLPLGLVVSAVAVLHVALAAALALWLQSWFAEPWVAGVVAVAVVAPLAAWQVRRAFSPVASLFRALSGTVASYQDGDYGFGLSWDGGGALGELVSAHNRLGDVLRGQRQALVQRELLLDTMVQHTPVAMVLVDPSRHIVHANLAARKLLGEGRRLEGRAFDALVDDAPTATSEAFDPMKAPSSMVVVDLLAPS